MTAVGGPIEEVSINGRIFPVASDADVSRKLGGTQNDVAMNGDGSGRLIKSRVPFELSGLMLECDDSRGDHEFLQDVADGQDFVPVAITFASGEVYQGTAQITDDLAYSSANSTISVSLKGPGKGVKQ